MSGAEVNVMDRYYNALNHIPPPGKGCHPYLLTLANLGVGAGVSPERLFDNIRENIPKGSRRISDREILGAIDKARVDHGNGIFAPNPRSKPIVNDGKATLKSIIGQGKYSDDADLWEASPIRLYDEPQRDAALFFSTVYEPDDLVWIGERYDNGIMGKTIRPAREWVEYLKRGGGTAPHIIVNPLDGIPRKTKAGDKDTLRGDPNVFRFPYCLVEFDNLSRDDQIRFWSAVKLPIVALIDSGGKSLHGWLDAQKLADIGTFEVWQSEIKCNLYDRLLAPIGVDTACSNPARLSRFPGHFRVEKGKWQRLLWLSPEGRSVCP